MRPSIVLSTLRRIAVLACLAAITCAATGRGEETGTDSNEELDLASFDALIDGADRQHWSFGPVAPPTVPSVKNESWVRNEIDRFILAKLEAKGWQPASAAPPRALLRRMYLDISGLPPTLAEQERALSQSTPSQTSPEYFDSLADDLLSRPSYGERWARHWLDVVRFAETNGYERDATKPSAWRYRDWVIRALNNDKPYNRFVIEQLAGDEIPDADSDTITATTYLRVGPWDDEPADPVEDQFDQLDDMVNTTSQVFLGLTLGCSRCHNHKFEPLTMHDYYRMVAIFRGLERPIPGRIDVDLPAGTPPQLAAIEERDRQVQAVSTQIDSLRQERGTALLDCNRSSLPEGAIAALKTAADKRTPEQKKLVDEHAAKFAAEVDASLNESDRQQLADWQQTLVDLKTTTPDLPRAYILKEPKPVPPATSILIRGKARRPGPEVAPGVPAVLSIAQPAMLPPSDRTSLRRLSFARWIADSDNPLTARVIVNRVWQHHFGQGLVRTPNDFGVMGDAPEHRELLDWLAHWFMQQGWSLKKLHRLILTSNTYRMATASRADYAEQDPENRLLWRQNYHRLDVEVIRDSALAISGRLDSRMYGPSVYPFIPQAAMEGHSDPDKIWPKYDEAAASRRTIYVFVKRSLVVPMIEVLDFCDTTKTAPQRVITSIAPQALALFNGQFVMEQAGHLADRLEREVGNSPAAQIDRAFQLAFCRQPTQSEQDRMLAFMDRVATELEQNPGPAAGEKLADPKHAALVQLCRVIMNMNEFVYAD